MPPKPETHSRFFCEIQPVLDKNVMGLNISGFTAAETLQCHLSPFLWLSHNLKFSWIQRAACGQLILKMELCVKLGGGKQEGKRKKTLRGIGKKDKYFWLIFAGILLPRFGTELRALNSFAHSHTMRSPKQIIQQRGDHQWGGRGWLSSGRSSNLCCHTGKDYPRDQQWNPGLIMPR